ncbi:MAG: hypothetical protein PW791_16840 [Neorhizobium sp.]|nr:hypothetical protein [Neorhizobium sp.]
MRVAFYALLSAAVVFIGLDMREMITRNDGLPAYDPLHGDPAILPPALTRGVPDQPPIDPATKPDVLRQPIRFTLEKGGVMKAEGAIDPGAADRFKAELDQRGEYVKTISLDSPGGSVSDAIAMSALIRERKLDTIVATRALCASSCPIILSGGVKRVAQKDAIIGVHQVFSGGGPLPSAAEAMSSAQTTTARIARHLDLMGIAPGLWLKALETPPDRLSYLTAKDMADFRLTTPVAATTPAPLPTSGQAPAGAAAPAAQPAPAAKPAVAAPVRRNG